MEEMNLSTVTPGKVEQDTPDKKDGMHLIMGCCYELPVLRNYIKTTCLANKSEFLESTDDVEEICKRFTSLLKGDDLNLDELTTIFVASCMCYYLENNPESIEWRSQFLQKSFQYSDTLSPMHLHIATKRLWGALKNDTMESCFNILNICHQIAFASETGRAIAVCLMWTILCEITETPHEMHRFYEFSELNKMLNDVHFQQESEEKMEEITYILVQCIGFLINIIVFNSNEDFKKAGYRNYFSFTKRELEKLKNYAENMERMLQIKVCQSDSNYELRMIIKEYLNINIINILQEKISEL